MKSAMNVFLLFLLCLNFYSCNEEEFLKNYPGADGYVDFDPPSIKPGVVYDPKDLPPCHHIAEQFFEGSCLVFADSFERSNIVDHKIFNWDVAIMDYGGSGSNIDAKIETSAHLGPQINGDKAVLFRGREGGSTHEVYLVSNPIDFTGFKQVYIQFRYVPLHLESTITLSHSGEVVPESIRLDICKDNDFNCGLSGSNRHLRLRDPSGWDRGFLDPLEFGRKLNIRNYVENDWKLAQYVIDLDDYPDRIDNFVFKIAAALDEGYKGNDRANFMDDGIILDEVIVIALHRDIPYL